MNHEQEPTRRPTWRTPLRAFKVARDAYIADPTPAHRSLAQRLGAIRTEELLRPGKVTLGQVVATPGSLAVITTAAQIPPEFLLRHKHGDWGELNRDDRRANEHALLVGTRLLSAYQTRTGEKLWIITEGDRSATTLLLPEEH